MANYVISDLHGNYEAYQEMLEKIKFSSKDLLYVLGDVFDRGPHSIRILLDLMERPNVVCLAGNHEYMALKCMSFLTKEITKESLQELYEKPQLLEEVLNWQQNGGDATLAELKEYTPRQRKEILDFVAEWDVYEEVEAGGKEYLLVHAGLGNFEPERPIWDYGIEELVWERPDYEVPYFADRYVITGHTPTQVILQNPKPGYIFRKNHHIAIDCGCGFGGRLGCICLDTGEEFYVESKF
ncbi:MAG: serine/threonine protein phosphatase [Lachnospiraceae bacterium]|nr:serine/threonine protein phosphatase [Lachnospiraceae bacterium]